MSRCEPFIVNSCGMLPTVGTNTVIVMAYLGTDHSICSARNLWAVGADFH